MQTFILLAVAIDPMSRNERIVGFLNDTYGNHEYYTPATLTIELKQENKLDRLYSLTVSGGIWMPCDYPNDSDREMERESFSAKDNFSDEDIKHMANKHNVTFDEMCKLIEEDYVENMERDLIMCGQIVDTLYEKLRDGEYVKCYLTPNEFRDLVSIWKKYHFEDKVIPQDIIKYVQEIIAKLPEFTYTNEEAGATKNFQSVAT